MAKPIAPETLQFILDRFDYHRKAGRGISESYRLVALETNYAECTIGQIVNRMRPTVGAARLYLRSKALRMARRLVKEAKAPELLDILSRPSMGVIDPAAKSEGGGGGFFLSVQAQDCGAVKIGVATGQSMLPSAPVAEEFDPFSPQSEEERSEKPNEAPEAPEPRFLGRSQATQDAIAAARIRLANQREAKARRDQRRDTPTGVWLVDADTQESE